VSNGDLIPDRILRLLSDGKRHAVPELLEIVKPSGIPALHQQISLLRKRLNQKGEDIVCVRRGYASFYQHVRLLYDPYSGRF